MRKLIRFFTELTSTATFTVGLFVLPVVMASLGGHILSSMDTDEPAEERVVYWEPLPGPSGDGVLDGEQKAEDTERATADRGDGDGASSGPESAASRSDGASSAATEAATATLAVHRPHGPPVGREAARKHFAERGMRLRPPDADGSARRRGGGEDGSRRGQRCEGPPDHDGIASAGGREWHVDRSVIDYYVGSLDRMQSLVGWVARHEDDWGKLDGAQIGGIPCDSILREAGLQSGDVIHEVNGQPIRSIPGAWRAYRKLKRDDVLEVDISRRGRSLVLVYYVG